MSSSDDSETAEWEREQMLRGTQSKRQKCPQPTASSAAASSINVNIIKKQVNEDIENAEANMESIKRNIGSTRLEIVKSEKRIEAVKRRIEEIEAANQQLKKDLINIDQQQIAGENLTTDKSDNQ